MIMHEVLTSSLASILGLSRQDCLTRSRILSTTSPGRVGKLLGQSALSIQYSRQSFACLGDACLARKMPDPDEESDGA